MIVIPDIYNCKVCIIGLGYVGLPIALEINKNHICLNSGKKVNRKIVGFDISKKRIDELQNGIDKTNEVTKNDLLQNKEIFFTYSEEDIIDSDIFIVTVPTPIDTFNNPDLDPIKNASELIGNTFYLRGKNKSIKSKPLVIFESTVYPGLTEEICIPIIENLIKGKVNLDFLCGYSPERINPGDHRRTISSIIKVTSGMDEITSNLVDSFYSSFIKAGTHKTKSIKIAETAKVIENTQRDINIALVNELAIICRKLNIDTLEVLDAASTKWNFLDFKPGLVGGHCISVDPYYLTYRSIMAGYIPRVVLAGRKTNDYIGDWIIEELISTMTRNGFTLSKSKFLILGITFKENCPDMRNSGVIKLIKKIRKYGISVTVVDPYVQINDKNLPLEIDFFNQIPLNNKFDSIIAAVSHDEYKNLSSRFLKNLISPKGLFVDIKGILPRDLDPIRL